MTKNKKVKKKNGIRMSLLFYIIIFFLISLSSNFFFSRGFYLQLGPGYRKLYIYMYKNTYKAPKTRRALLGIRFDHNFDSFGYEYIRSIIDLTVSSYSTS